jgi:hypothetical protein
MFNRYLSGFRNGFLIFFPGFDPNSENKPSFDKFHAQILKVPATVRMHTVMSALDHMLTNQLEYIYYFLGLGPFRQALSRIKKEITEPLAVRRELVKRYHIDENLFRSIKRADRVVRLVKGV